ncbi:hypothetical protein COY32_04895 [candidate division WWE3 bacterium CG_4_10_14_0_2_um_filter_41_14]|uniref:Uncharacterized protein n=1 Tax=candidate division WWE3 bacterium CG_4_10_14_0_2_um_filter_41_14 TaxID=1975072 RepID=A0A2M7THD5_UNCKA|nr:MAG: hypothetical protein COY32_04895 [candidate division WWE3 bacterium CG_4_10_14_0_2_um_filter_41_14]
MLLISHLYTALRLVNVASPSDQSVYYLNSILPDIRYTASINRERTHIDIDLTPQVFADYIDAYKGYSLHLLIDANVSRWDLLNKIKLQYPFFLRQILKTSIINIVLEVYCLEKIKLQPSIFLSKDYLSVYQDLGISKDDLEDFVAKMEPFMSSYSFAEVEKVMLSDEKLAHNPKIKNYIKIGRLILNNAHIKQYLIGKVDPLYETFLIDLSKEYAKVIGVR